MDAAAERLLDDFLADVRDQKPIHSNGDSYCRSPMEHDEDALMEFSSDDEDDASSNADRQHKTSSTDARRSESSSTVVDYAQELDDEQHQSTGHKLVVEHSTADLGPSIADSGPATATAGAQAERILPTYRHFFQNADPSHEPLKASTNSASKPPTTVRVEINTKSPAVEDGSKNQETGVKADGRNVSIKVENGAALVVNQASAAGPEVIVLPKNPRDFPPGISFLDVPKYATVRDLLGMVRIPHARVRLVVFSQGPSPTAKLYFADRSIHDLFLNRARKGLVTSPWSRDLSIVIDEHDELDPTDHELTMARATRVLQIINLPTKKMKFDSILDMLKLSNPGPNLRIERALLFKRGIPGDALVMQFNFLSMVEAIKAKLSLERGELCIRWPLVTVDFADDECSSTAKVIPPNLIMQVRGSDAPSSPQNRLSAIGTLMFPLSPLPPPPVKILAIKPIPIAAAPSRPPIFSLPRDGPSPGPVNGIYILQVPMDTTIGQLLSSFRGGAVACAKLKGRLDAEIFLKDPGNNRAILRYLRGNGGFLLLKADGQAGRRYAALATSRQHPPEGRSNFPLSTRRVSIVFDNTVANNAFGTKFIEHYAIKYAAFKLESAEAPERHLVEKPGSSQQEIILSFPNIAMAVEAKRVLEALKVIGSKAVVKFAPDPCDRPYREMR